MQSLQRQRIILMFSKTSTGKCLYEAVINAAEALRWTAALSVVSTEMLNLLTLCIQKFIVLFRNNLISFCAFTGSDTVSSFSDHGKRRTERYHPPLLQAIGWDGILQMLRCLCVICFEPQNAHIRMLIIAVNFMAQHIHILVQTASIW